MGRAFLQMVTSDLKKKIGRRKHSGENRSGLIDLEKNVLFAYQSQSKLVMTL